MNSRRVLIVTYYWPPSGGSGVQRWLKMAKYLPEFGWEPIIYTPQNPELMARDEELLGEISPNLQVWKRPIFEPYSVYKWFTGKKGENLQPGFISDSTKKSSWKERLALFIRSNLFFPDPRCFWRRPSVRYLKKQLKKEPVDWIITTGPPHSMHLIGKELHRKTGIPWLADFRDPWTGMYYFKHLKMLPYIVRRHKKAERAVVHEANVVTVVSPQMKRDFLPLGTKRIEVIPNGYDDDDFVVEREVETHHAFTICHTGLFTRDANPDQFWRAIASIVRENKDFAQDLRIVLVGQTDGVIKKSIEDTGLSPSTQFVSYVPHLEAVTYQKEANILLLSLKKEPESKGIITGKFFEYLAARKPILGIGPVDGDLAEILTQCNAGTMHEFEDFEGVKRSVLHYYSLFCQKKRWDASLPQAIAAYSRKNLCGKMAELLTSSF
ncbi:MAG: glycosyltransferase family 4 protein [Bacteroidales bacterium]|nr:glycosyltransferase family 4 protein [Bacteroidales bacterium]